MENTKPSTAGTRIISVGGGKGGVGKSLVSTNLAVTIAQAGHEVVLCDLDLGAANLHLMLGLTHPRPGITTLLSGDGESGGRADRRPRFPGCACWRAPAARSPPPTSTTPRSCGSSASCGR